MARVKGGVLVNSSYESTVAKPFDARTLVPSYTDLLDVNNWLNSSGSRICYNGMIVAVTDTSDPSLTGLYMLFDAASSRKPDVTNAENWIKLADLSDVSEAREIELNASETHIQWRYKGDTEWVDLFDLSTLKGKDGTNGLDGISITNSEINTNGELVLTFSDDSTKNVGKVVGTDGKDGTNGIDGADGKSAYELACEDGFEGSVTEWLDSLIGAAGKDGVDGTNGTDGVDGTNGKSAYELAVDDGFEGDVQSWLASLVGASGQDGISITNAAINDLGNLVITLSTGDTVDVGRVVGADGADGKDFTYEMFTEEQLADLKGEPGINGKDFTYEDFTQEQLNALKGSTPYIQDGYWYIDGQNTNVKAEGKDGKDASVVFQIVESVDAVTETGIIYLIKRYNESGFDYYDEYILVDSKPEQIGTTEIDLSNYYTKTDADSKFATLDTLSDYAKKSDIPDTSNFITMEDVEEKGYLTEHQDISGKADKADTYTKEEVNKLIPDVSNFITDIPSEYVTETDLDSKGYLTAIPEEYAKKTDLPTIPTNVSEFNNDAGYLTSIPTDYAKKSDIPTDYLTQDDLDGYSKFSGSYNDLTDKPEIPSIDGLASEQWVQDQGYLTEHQSLEEYAKKTDIPTDYLKANNWNTLTTSDGWYFDDYVVRASLSSDGLSFDYDGQYTMQVQSDRLYVQSDNGEATRVSPLGMIATDTSNRNQITYGANKIEVIHFEEDDDCWLSKTPDTFYFPVTGGFIATQEYVQNELEEAIKSGIELADYYSKEQVDANFIANNGWESNSKKDGWVYNHGDISAILSPSSIKLNDGAGSSELTIGNVTFVDSDGSTSTIYGPTSINHKVSSDTTYSLTFPESDGVIATQEYVDAQIAKVPGGDIDLSNYYTKDELNQKGFITSTEVRDALAITPAVQEGARMYANVSVGGISKGTNISGMTIEQLIVRLLDIRDDTSIYPPIVPENNESVAFIINTSTPSYKADENGLVTTEGWTYLEYPSAEANDNQTETGFYQITEGREVIESGYQVRMNQSDRITNIILPDYLILGENVAIEAYDEVEGEWKTAHYEFTNNFDDIAAAYTTIGASVPSIATGYVMWAILEQSATDITYRFVILN